MHGNKLQILGKARFCLYNPSKGYYMTLKELLSVVRDTTRIKIVDAKGNALTANLHKRDIIDEYNDCKVLNVCVRYQGNGHTVRFYMMITVEV